MTQAPPLIGGAFFIVAFFVWRILYFLECSPSKSVNSDHAHPAAEHTKRVHRVERLRAAAHLHDRERASLGRADAGRLQREPVDLVLEHRGERAVTLRAAPHLPSGHSDSLQFDHLRVIGRRAVDHRQAVRVEHSRLGAEGLQQALGLERQKAAKRRWTQRAIQQQDPGACAEADGGCSFSLSGMST